MSVQTEVDRIKNNIRDALNAISRKGVYVPPNSNSDDLVTLIKAIKIMKTFDVEGLTMEFELGMTWSEFIESPYNQGVALDEDGFVTFNTLIYDSDGVAVYCEDLIIENMHYVTH